MVDQQRGQNSRALGSPIYSRNLGPPMPWRGFSWHWQKKSMELPGYMDCKPHPRSGVAGPVVRVGGPEAGPNLAAIKPLRRTKAA
jgi:hypothetical protein